MLFETPKLSPQEEMVIGQIDELRQLLKNRVSRSKQWVGLLRRSLFARALRGSNSIEGYQVTVDDAMAAVEEERPLDAEGVTWAAVNGYRNAMTYILQLADAPIIGGYYGMHLFSALHFMIMNYDMTKRPGTFRTGPIYVRRDGDEIVYEGPDPDIVWDLSAELCDKLNKEKESPPKVRAAICHLNLVMIHPYVDGNGRLARCFQSLVLAREGFSAPEFCSIEEWLGKNTPK
jgi:Fic family protein